MGSDGNSTRRSVVIAAGIIALAGLLVCWYVWWATPPQMGADEEVFAAVDALFTAVTAHLETRVTKTMVSGGFSPRQLSRRLATARCQTRYWLAA